MRRKTAMKETAIVDSRSARSAALNIWNFFLIGKLLSLCLFIDDKRGCLFYKIIFENCFSSKNLNGVACDFLNFDKWGYYRLKTIS